MPTQQPQILQVKLGKLAPKLDDRTLNFSDFLTKPTPPPVTNFWPKEKVSFPLRTFGNDKYGDCTRASQAEMQLRMEYLETQAIPNITDDAVIAAYDAMENKYYGGGDNGASELVALNCWRDPKQTFKDASNNAYTISAYTKVNQKNIEEVKQAIALSGAHGIKVCFNLPIAWQSVQSLIWDIPKGQKPTGNYAPGSWGGHSMFARDYDETWLYLPSTWAMPDGKISWTAFALYCDEAYSVVDSVDKWRTANLGRSARFDIEKLVAEVNKISSIKI